MRIVLIILTSIMLGGCATAWQDLSETERQAWIISGAVVIGAALLADGMSSDTNTVKQCFPQRSLETDCIGH